VVPVPGCHPAPVMTRLFTTWLVRVSTMRSPFTVPFDQMPAWSAAKVESSVVAEVWTVAELARVRAR
jgi:hypothetical protein